MQAAQVMETVLTAKEIELRHTQYMLTCDTFPFLHLNLQFERDGAESGEEYVRLEEES
jgi:hypothetical protein